MARFFDEAGWGLFDYDIETGRSVWVAQVDGEEVFRIDYPVDDIVNANAERYNNGQGQRWGDGKRIASIPLNTFYAELDQAHLQGDDAYLSRWLNDSDHRAFRTFPGRV